MSCGPDRATFRLLDAFLGWDDADPENIVGLHDPAGLHLARVKPDALTDAEIAPYLLPPRLARGCGPCDWYLLTPAPSRLMRRGPCFPEWVSLWDADCCDPSQFVAPVAVAARDHRLAVADPGAGRIWIWDREGDRLSAEINVAHVSAIAFAPWGELLVATDRSRAVLRFGPDGSQRGALARLPADAGVPNRLAASNDCAVWGVTCASDNLLYLWRVLRGETEFVPTSLSALKACFPLTTLRVSTDAGFCLEEMGKDGLPHTTCYSWYGRPLASSDVGQPETPSYQTYGQLLTAAIDSGIPRCRWHRVRIDADVPKNTKFSVAVATNEVPKPRAQGDPNADPEWKDFRAGRPHPIDWQEGVGGSLDFLIDQPPGRYLFVRLRLSGDGKSTPVVRRVRFDFPRSTSLEFLPPVYRENPDAEDFTERFLALFDASIADLDRAIERFPAMLDPEGVPDEVLPWLGSFLDLAFDPAWEAPRRRAILCALPRLYRQRGTIAGLVMAIRLVFDVETAIQEAPRERPWSALGHGTRLRGVRLFGKAMARFRLGSSPLGGAPLKSYGDPDHDPLAAGAYRFRVLVPPGRLTAGIGLERLRRMVERQKPAHTLASVRLGGTGFVLGTWSAVGVDTVFAPLPAPVLGGKGKPDVPGNLRLNRMSVLRASRRGPRAGFVLGERGIVGVQSVME